MNCSFKGLFPAFFIIKEVFEGKSIVGLFGKNLPKKVQ